jgi:hypothetical protein
MSQVEVIKQLLRNAVETATGWTTVISPAHGPTPANQYCLLTLKEIETLQRDVIRFTETTENLKEHQRQESTLRFEVQTRGTGAMEVMQDLIAYLDSSLREIDLWGLIGSGGHDSVHNISTYVNGKILPVALLNIEVHATLPKENVIEFMNSLDITTKIDDNNSMTTTVP